MAGKSKYYNDVSGFIHQIETGWIDRKFHKDNGAFLFLVLKKTY